ncbi:MAG TPA: acyltransferase [Roseococcus sp.]|jgi:peptidoglycan/LPS O-acetylase OafA/YrhL|nr:acyltransferase [Roseococcus sp.]
MQSANIAYMPRLDHLRFYAAFIVLLYHFFHPMLAQQDNPLLLLLLVREGYGGVALFMVLTGFILTSICLGREVRYRAFLMNRLLRIYPLYIVAVCIAAFAFGRQVDALSFVALATFLGNLSDVKLPHFPHLWTIMVEFQFYLLFPLLMIFVRRAGLGYLAGILALFLSMRLLVFFLDGTVQDASYWTLLGRLDQFVLGMLLAVLHRKRSTLLANPAWLAVALLTLQGWLMAFVWWSGGYFGEDTPHSPSIAWAFSPLLEGAAYGFVLLAYLHVRWPLPASEAMQRLGAQASAAFAWLGTISYSIYVRHFPFAMLHHRMMERGWEMPIVGGVWYLEFLFVLLPSILAVSALSYYVIERPFLAMRVKYLAGAVRPLPVTAPARQAAYSPARGGLSSARP